MLTDGSDVELRLPRRTHRLVLRAIRDGDAEAVLAYRSRADVSRYLETEPMTASEASAFVAERAGATGIAGDGDRAFVVVERDGRVIGDLSLRVGLLVHGQGEIGWVFDPSVGGHGYATEAAAALVDEAFDVLGLHRVWAQLDPRNAASADLCRRLGMRREALLREESWFKGEWGDLEIWAVLADEWPTVRP
jgi:RimJ/RimL family protein N-acetyltransferase